MKVQWDYTELANAYLKRPSYSEEAIDDMLSLANISSGDDACDIGAGAAHLTLMLLKRGLKVNAVEPNDAMRSNGILRTEKYENIQWFEGTGENTFQNDNSFNIVTFGSSFNVTNQQEALKESKRILKEDGWFACMWNHRVLTDPLQNEIENIIKFYIKDYGYGSRRDDQTDIINASGLFSDTQSFEGKIIHSISSEDFIEAWKSHGTLYRQAKGKFGEIILEIEKVIRLQNSVSINVPYITKGWMAKAIK